MASKPELPLGKLLIRPPALPQPANLNFNWRNLSRNPSKSRKSSRRCPGKRKARSAVARPRAGKTKPLHQNNMGNFVSVADVKSLPPGHGRTVHIKGREFALFNVEGQFYAIDDTCPHRGGPLGAGYL